LVKTAAVFKRLLVKLSNGQDHIFFKRLLAKRSKSEISNGHNGYWLNGQIEKM